MILILKKERLPLGNVWLIKVMNVQTRARPYHGMTGNH